MTFDARQKRMAISREIKLRRQVYRGRVTRGLMKQNEADYEIAVMQAIEADYRKQEQDEEPPLFRAPVPP